MLTMKERRELYKREMAERHKESFSQKDDSGRFKGIFETSKRAGVKFWKCSEDDHEITIVPYLTGNQDPRLPPGKPAFFLYVFVHRGVGVNENSYICLNRTYNGKPCPICEYQKELREATDIEVSEDAIKALNPTKRAIYNIVCKDSAKEENVGVQIWDVSHYLFTVPLEELAHKKKGGGDVPYADDTIGKIISFRQKGSKRNLEYTAFEFKDREPLSDEVLESAVCLDELLHKPTYEEVYDAFWAGKKEERKEEVQERGDSRREEKEEEEEEKEAPIEADSRRKPSLKKKEEEEDVSEEVEKYTECPYGAAFGSDFDQYDECEGCEARSDCEEKKAQLSKPAPRKKLSRRDK